MEKIKTVGTREEVYHGKAKHTLGGLFKDDIFINKKGDYASKKMSSAVKSRFIQLIKPATSREAREASDTSSADTVREATTTDANPATTDREATTVDTSSTREAREASDTKLAEKMAAIEISGDLPYVKRVKTAFLQIRGYLPNRGKIRVFYDEIMENTAHIDKTLDELKAFIVAEARIQKIKL